MLSVLGVLWDMLLEDWSEYAGILLNAQDEKLRLLYLVQIKSNLYVLYECVEFKMIEFVTPTIKIYLLCFVINQTPYK